VTLDLLRGGGDTVKRVAAPVVRAETSRIDTMLSLDDLTPGGYRLLVTATDGAVAAQREAGFIVR
jgi:hypothetical protein